MYAPVAESKMAALAECDHELGDSAHPLLIERMEGELAVA
jgi:hypothetical protein